ncbi:MAG TPA: UpxY family transcription antiterminator [Terriglobales bacterium]|nr:UpxY family transcription antiterminator [Terriglobales bacterium]
MAATDVARTPSSAERPEASWYAVHTRARHEKKIDANLQRGGIATFLPLVKEVRRWSDRRKSVELPLFPCYVFVHLPLTPALRLEVLRTPGVLAFVGRSSEAARISDQEIEQVRTLLAQKVPFGPSPFLKAGQRIRIRGGALDGMEGILSSQKGQAMLVISIEPIQRSIAVSISGYEFEPA